MSSNLFFNMNPLDAYFINQSNNPGKRVVLRTKGGYTQATPSFQLRLANKSTAHDLVRSLAS